MKKMLAIILAMVMALTSAACGKTPEADGSGGGQDSSLVQRITSIRYGTDSVTLTYDGDGLTELVRTSGDRVTSRETFDGSFHRRTSTVYYGSDGQISEKYEFEYDEAGNMVRETAFNQGQQVYVHTFDYDAYGTLISQTNSSGDQELSRYVYEFQNDGLPFKKKQYSKDLLVAYTLYHYNRSGLLAKADHYFYDKLEKRETLAYDADGNCTSHLTFNFNNDYEHTTRYTYNDNGGLTELSRYTNGQLQSRRLYDYDSQGFMTGYRTENGEGQTISEATVTYEAVSVSALRAGEWASLREYLTLPA